MRHPKGPEHTAVRVALWRALHVQIDAKPHVLSDEVGLQLSAVTEDWRKRPDMDPQWTRRVRASIVARARFIEDLVKDLLHGGVTQYVILGAGLDTFAQRRPELMEKLKVFEIDQPGPQAWKIDRLQECGFKIPENLHFVPVDFEAGESWWELLIKSGFDAGKPAVVVSTGVAMYLTKETNRTTLRHMANLAPGSTYAMTFMLPIELLEEEDQPSQVFTIKKAAEAGTPFISFYSPAEMLELAQAAGFKHAACLMPNDIRQLYFEDRTDHLTTASGEVFLVAST